MTKVAHIYPGLRYKTGVMKREVLECQVARQRLDQASETLGRDIPSLCQSKYPFTSTMECFVVSLAVYVAAGTNHVQRHGAPDAIVGSSFGHYGALAMAGALDYGHALMAVKAIGAAIDEVFSGFFTFLIARVPHEKLQSFVSSLNCTAALINYTDGLAITAPGERSELIARFVQNEGGYFERVPLRLDYHSPFMGKAEQRVKDHLANLQLGEIRVPFVSTFLAGYVTTTEALRQILLRQFCGTMFLEETVLFLKNQGLERVHIHPYQVTTNYS